MAYRQTYQGTRDERRREPRLSADIAVSICLLGAGEPRVAARVLDLSGSGLLLTAPRPFPVNAPVRIEGADRLLLGDVSRCEEGAAEWRIAVHVRHALTKLVELERLNRNLLGREPDSEPVAVRMRVDKAR